MHTEKSCAARPLQITRILGFIGLTYGLSLLPWLVCFTWQIDPFSELRWMPLLLPMVWAPSLVGAGFALREGRLKALLRAHTRGPESWFGWSLVVSPLLVVGVYVVVSGSAASHAEVPWIPLLAMQLLLGPLGEEAGWRGTLLPLLAPLGTLGGPLSLGLVWGLWHAPLWWLDSPHARISFPVFVAMCLCFSVVASALYWLRPCALLPVVLLHWLINVSIGWLELVDILPAHLAYSTLLPYYSLLAFCVAWLHWRRGPRVCLQQAGAQPPYEPSTGQELRVRRLRPNLSGPKGLACGRQGRLR